MNIQKLIQILIDSGVEPNEAKCEVRMLCEHFCNYNELDKLRGKNLTGPQLALLEENVRK